MTIQYPGGKATEALVLSMDERSIRAAVSGDDDVRVFLRSEEGWVAEDGQAVTVKFAWEQDSKAAPDESHFVCPKPLGMKAISRLLNSPAADPGEKPLYVFSS